MNLLTTFIVWTWLLGIALVAPTTLPAGGAQKFMIQQRKNNIKAPLIAVKEFKLHSSASNNSSVLTPVKVGTPVSVLKVWNSSKSGKWLLVNVLSQDFYQFFYKKGWVNVSNF